MRLVPLHTLLPPCPPLPLPSCLARASLTLTPTPSPPLPLQPHTPGQMDLSLSPTRRACLHPLVHLLLRLRREHHTLSVGVRQHEGVPGKGRGWGWGWGWGWGLRLGSGSGLGFEHMKADFCSAPVSTVRTFPSSSSTTPWGRRGVSRGGGRGGTCGPHRAASERLLSPPRPRARARARDG